jgi:predicted Zn-dependent peptidase
MIEFEKFKLENGLTVIFHKDPTTPLAIVNTLYDVGSRDESEDKTGFAHLFEHLMFGGSINISDFDAPLQMAGGESNAFTSNDITNYYNILPAVNLETALWLESDRMLSLAFTQKSLDVQKNVVIEEFKQRYLNQPYGEVWLKLSPLAYKVHPYKWPTIGKEIKHIEEATLADVKAFFYKYYIPSNAILCIAGNFELDFIKNVVNKYYGDIPSGIKPARILPAEPQQNEYREMTIDRNVPADAFYYAFKMPERRNEGYYMADLLSDLLGRDKSSRLYIALKKELQLCSEIGAYISGSHDEGLLVISGKLNSGISFEQLNDSLWKVLNDIQHQEITPEEMQRLKIKFKTTKEFQDEGILNRAMSLCHFELLGDANGINEENLIYEAITSQHLKEMATKILKPTNCSLLKVKAEQNA